LVVDTVQDHQARAHLMAVLVVLAAALVDLVHL
jgi:hypothetical protein